MDYTFDMSATSDVLNDAARLEKITYPDGRVLFHDYGGTGTSTAINDRFSRVTRLRETSGGGGEKLALYLYNDNSRIVRVDYETPDLRLDYIEGSSGTYKGFE